MTPPTARQATGAAPGQFAKNDRITLVRWHNTREGWQAETVEGRYAGRDSDNWHLRTATDVTDYPRSEWEGCKP